MYNFLVFAGTTEGRGVAKYLSNKNVKVHVCVATEYGETLLPKGDNITISSIRLDQSKMTELMKERDFDLVLDATHPYAVEVSSNIVNACNETKTEYLRILRDSEDDKLSGIYVNSIEEAVDYLSTTVGNVLITTGSKELSKFTRILNYKERLYPRVLSTYSVIEEVRKLGFEGKNLMCMQGPFSEEFNYALIKQIDAKYIVTKESGKIGGFIEKIAAASRANITPIIIGRPIEEKGVSYSELINILDDRFNIRNKREVYLIGIGMGNYKNMTIEAEELIKSADVIIGAKRMINSFSYLDKPTFTSYKPEEILEFLENHNEFNKIAITLSGDIGFYSGAEKLKKALVNYETKLICGISSVVYLSSKLEISWEDASLLSLHGREGNIIDSINNNKKTFALLDGRESVGQICKSLIKFGLDEVEVIIGENLSYENEKIVKGVPKEFIDSEFDSLSVILIINNNFNKKIVTHGIPDEEFIRGEVPMTKSEVRGISLSKLQLKEDSIVYDIGAGTGSVSIEMALQAVKGKVYAIEKNPKGIELINKNKIKFRTSNLEVIEGIAPSAIIDLEIPTAAFIGGTSGSLKEIIKILLEKNPYIKIVINAITLETVGESIKCIKELSLKNVDITQVSISKGKSLGNYNMMIGQNPIYIISFEGI